MRFSGLSKVSLFLVGEDNKPVAGKEGLEEKTGIFTTTVEVGSASEAVINGLEVESEDIHGNDEIVMSVPGNPKIEGELTFNGLPQEVVAKITNQKELTEGGGIYRLSNANDKIQYVGIVIESHDLMTKDEVCFVIPKATISSTGITLQTNTEKTSMSEEKYKFSAITTEKFKTSFLLSKKGTTETVKDLYEIDLAEKK